MEGTEGDDRTAIVSGGSEEVVGEVRLSLNCCHHSGKPSSANKINNPAVINKGNRIPTTNEPTQCRLSVGFVRVPNQKKRLPIMETCRLTRTFSCVASS